MPQQIHLAAYILTPSSHFIGSWRHPFSRTDFLNRALFESIGRTLEEGLFDLAFLPDLLAIPESNGSYESYIARGSRGVVNLDPTQILGVIAGVTRHLGLGATMSATFYPPYALARILASLDHLSGGRVAWNIVTTADDTSAQNFGRPAVAEHDSRYDRGDHVLTAITRLWRSWDGGALLLDKESGAFADPAKIHRLDYDSGGVAVRGPFQLPPTPQTHPVLFQAGASERGRDFAARWAESIFLIQSDAEHLIEIRDDIRNRADKIGRDPDRIKFFPAVQVVLGETELVARSKQQALADWTDPAVARDLVSKYLGADVTSLPADVSLDDLLEQLGDKNGATSTRKVVLERLIEHGSSIADVAQRYAETHLTPQLVGTPAQVADQLQQFVDAGAADGFVLTPTSVPGTFEDVTRGLVPELQRRGVYRTEYTGTTLRDHLGVGDPDHTRWERGDDDH